MTISCNIEHGIARCSFDCGKVNAFTRSDIQELETLIQKTDSLFPQTVRMMILESSKISPKGFPIFCAGADQKERVGWSNQKILDHLKYQRAVIHRLRESPVCVVSCVNGLALGLGTELCLASDFVMASEDSSFGFPEKTWGIIPGAGGYAWAHGWAPHPEKAQEYIESGKWFTREEAQWLGIVDIICDADDFNTEIQYLLDVLCAMTPEEQLLRKKTHHEKIDYKFYFDEEQNAYEQKLIVKKSNQNLV